MIVRKPMEKKRISFPGSLNEIEEQVIRESYQRYRGDISTMLQALGIGRTTLWRKLKRYGLSKE